MNFECKESPLDGGWAVEAINFAEDGQIFRALFTGPASETRAKEYAQWQNSKVGPQDQHQQRTFAA